MLRNAMIALIAMASLTFLPSNAASARGGGMYGGGMHMGGGGMHFGGGHFSAGHFGGGHVGGGHFGGFHHHFGGIGFYPFPVYDYYPYEERRLLPRAAAGAHAPRMASARGPSLRIIVCE